MDIGIAALRFGDWIVVRSWWVVTPTIGLVTGGYHSHGVAIAVSNNLTPMILEVTGQRVYYETGFVIPW